VKRPPPNLPTEGDRAKLRGRERCGQVDYITPSNWCKVTWDDGQGPKLCHLHELERIDR
jgi:hypothetical protein